MKVDIKETGVELLAVFEPVTLRTAINETLSILMKKGGFEFEYNGNRYQARNGEVRAIKVINKPTIKPKLEKKYITRKAIVVTLDRSIKYFNNGTPIVKDCIISVTTENQYRYEFFYTTAKLREEIVKGLPFEYIVSYEVL